MLTSTPHVTMPPLFTAISPTNSLADFGGAVLSNRSLSLSLSLYFMLLLVVFVGLPFSLAFRLRPWHHCAKLNPPRNQHLQTHQIHHPKLSPFHSNQLPCPYLFPLALSSVTIHSSSNLTPSNRPFDLHPLPTLSFSFRNQISSSPPNSISLPCETQTFACDCCLLTTTFNPAPTYCDNTDLSYHATSS